MLGGHTLDIDCINVTWHNPAVKVWPPPVLSSQVPNDKASFPSHSHLHHPKSSLRTLCLWSALSFGDARQRVLVLVPISCWLSRGRAVCRPHLRMQGHKSLKETPRSFFLTSFGVFETAITCRAMACLDVFDTHQSSICFCCFDSRWEIGSQDASRSPRVLHRLPRWLCRF